MPAQVRAYCGLAAALLCSALIVFDLVEDPYRGGRLLPWQLGYALKVGLICAFIALAVNSLKALRKGQAP